jgi:hypothetical protein
MYQQLQARIAELSQPQVELERLLKQYSVPKHLRVEKEQKDIKPSEESMLRKQFLELAEDFAWMLDKDQLKKTRIGAMS